MRTEVESKYADQKREPGTRTKTLFHSGYARQKKGCVNEVSVLYFLVHVPFLSELCQQFSVV